MASFNFNNRAFHNNDLDFNHFPPNEFDFYLSDYTAASFSSNSPSTPKDDIGNTSFPLDTALAGLPTSDEGQHMGPSTYDPRQQDPVQQPFPEGSAAVGAAQHFSFPGCTFPDNSTQFPPTAGMSAYGATAYAQPYMQTRVEVPLFPSLDQFPLDQMAPLPTQVPTQAYFPQQPVGLQTDSAVPPPPPPPPQPVAPGPPATTQTQQQEAHNSNRRRRHLCEHCNRTFFDPSGLAKHRKTHIHRGPGSRTGKMYVCRFCRSKGRTAVFGRSDQLKRHLKTCKHCVLGANGLPDGYRDGVGGMDAGMEIV